MNPRTKKILLGLLLPDLVLGILFISLKPYLDGIKKEDEDNAIIMLALILLMTFSATATAYFFKGLEFKGRQDKLLVWLNVLPFVGFIILYPQFNVLILALLVCPLLGFWFGKRYFDL